MIKIMITSIILLKVLSIDLKYVGTNLKCDSTTVPNKNTETLLDSIKNTKLIRVKDGLELKA